MLGSVLRILTAPCHTVVDVDLNGLLIEDIIKSEIFCWIVSGDVGARIDVFGRVQPKGRVRGTK